MRRVIPLAVLATATALTMSIAGCNSGGNNTGTGQGSGVIKVGLITKFPVDFYDTMVDAVKKYDADHADVEVIYGQGKSGTDDEGEIAIIENMIVQGVKAIAITPTSPNVQTALDKAVKAGIKVVLIDNDIPNWSGKSSVVATDNLAGGKLAGTWVAQHIKPGSKIGILQGRLGNPSLDDRVKGFKSTLGSAATVVAEPATDCDQTKGLNAAQDLLTAHPDVAAIYGACGPPIVGALQAIKAAGKGGGSILVVGFDAAPDELTAIKAGEEAGSVAQFPAKMGSLGIDTAVKAAKGESVPANVDTGTQMVTKDNVAQFS
jgi:ABC-type sugar transport system substrate-binding protein